MLYEYAVDPHVLSELGNCRTFFDNFQLHLGKVVSDVPNQWVREAFVAINGISHEQCQPVMKKTLKLKLKKLLDQSLCVNREVGGWNRSDRNWIDLVVDQNSVFPFAAVITDSSGSNPIKTYSMSGLLFEAPDCWNCDPQLRVPRNAKSIVDAMHPLLLISKEVTIIDPHMDPRTGRYRRVLIEIIQRLDQFNFGRGIKKLTYFNADFRGDMQAAMEQYLIRALPMGCEVVCCQWPEDIMHDRFVITDVGGIEYGRGTDETEGNHADEVRISLMSKKSLRQEWEPFKNISKCTRIIRVSS